MKTALLAALLFFSLPAHAQYVQGGAVNAAPDTVYQYTGSWAASASYSYTFPKPTTSPCTLVVTLRGSGMALADTQKNTFVSVPLQSGMLWYSTTCASALDTVTLTCPSGTCWAQFTVGEYAGVWVPDQVSPEIVALTSGAGWTALITPTQNGELVLGFGSNHTTNTPQITAGTGFTLRTPGVNQFVEDMIQATAAPIRSAVTYSAPNTWCQTTISFKPGGPPPPFVFTLNGFGSFTFPMQAPPDCSAGDCSLVWTGPNGTVTLLPRQIGSLVIRKPSGDTAVVSIGP